MPKVPGALVAVLVSIAVSAAIDAEGRGVEVVGSVPSGFPPIGLPEGAAGRVAGAAHGPLLLRADHRPECGDLAKLRRPPRREGRHQPGHPRAVRRGAGRRRTGTFVVNGSPTKTQILNSQGGRTQLANLTMAVIVLLFTMFFTGLLADMPKATLAGVVFMIGVSLVDVTGMRTIAASASASSSSLR